MSVDRLKQKIAPLRSDDRDQLLGYLLHLKRLEEDPEHIARVAGLLDDKSPGAWVSWEEVEQRLTRLENIEAASTAPNA